MPTLTEAPGAETSIARSIKFGFNVGLSVASKIRFALHPAAWAKTASHLLRLCLLARCRVGTPAARRPQKTRPAARAADRAGAESPFPDISMAVKNGSATIAGSANRITLLVDASTTMPKPIMIRSARKSGPNRFIRLLITRYMSAVAVSTNESTKPGDPRIVLPRNCDSG